MVFLAVYGVALIIYIMCPAFLEIFLFIANIFIPDPIPCVDEVIMGAVLLSKLKG